MNIAPLRTSELWLALVAVVLPVLVQQGVLTQEAATMAMTAAGTAIPFIVQAIVHKLRAGRVPFMHPTPAASPQPGAK